MFIPLNLSLQYDAHRARLLAADGNQLDCMFVDRRGSPDVHARGNRLVICCEGNAAYYELGLLEVPAKGGGTFFLVLSLF